MRLVLYSRTCATSDVCEVVLATSVDLTVVVPDDTVCVAGYKFRQRVDLWFW